MMKNNIEKIQIGAVEEKHGVCVNCGKEEVAIKKRGLCMKCYYKLRRSGDIKKSADICGVTEKKIQHAAELDFVKNYFSHSNWIYQPVIFRLNGSNYTPDFFDGERNVFIEVAGTRQAFHYNKEKYDLLERTYPQINFEVRRSDGSLLPRDIHGSYAWGNNPLNLHKKDFADLGMLNPYREPHNNMGEYHCASKLTRNQVLAIRNDPRTLEEISQDYGIHWQSAFRIKHHLTWKWLK